ncbi:MAG: NADH-quinone oxidoreductase subunit K [Puniceicoccaceae bacterium]|nr:MAG: NADH-quinone oxidoreductase subunit K [Puniceicoccaceae bacterium]
MTAEAHEIYALLAAPLFAVGLVGVFACRHFLKKIIAAKILGASAFLLLIALAARDHGEGPDPVPHAMVITGIVVAVSAAAFALTLARRIWQETGQSGFGEKP